MGLPLQELKRPSMKQKHTDCPIKKNIACGRSIKKVMLKVFRDMKSAINIDFGSVWFYSISTIVGYLKPNPLHTYGLYIFFIIQRVKARAITCPHQTPTRGDNTISVGYLRPNHLYTHTDTHTHTHTHIYIYIYVCLCVYVICKYIL